MPDPKDILVWVIAVPVAISLVAMLLSHLPLKRERVTQPWGPALAIAGAFAAAFAGLRGRIGFPPRDAQTWLAYLGAAAVLIGIAATVAGPKRWRWPVVGASVVLILGTVWLLARSQIPIFGWQHFLLRAAVVAICMVGWWLLMDRLAARSKAGAGAAATLPLILTITASVAAIPSSSPGSRSSSGRGTCGLAAPTAACRPTRSWGSCPASSSSIATSPTSSCTRI